jgi:glycosyltransferase involved in cell wall biosynthesis
LYDAVSDGLDCWVETLKIAFLHFWTFRMRRGIETMVVSLANELAALGQQVSIVTAAASLEPLVSPTDQVHVKAYPTFRYFEFRTIVPFYAFDLLRRQYDVVVVFFSDFGEGAALKLTAPFVQTKTVLYLAFPVESAPHRYHAYLRWGLDRNAATILADAKYTAEQGETYFQRPVQLLPSGTDPNRFRRDEEKRANLRKQLGYEEEDILLLNVAALEERKGIWRVIEALPVICSSCPQVHYLVLGNGRDRERLERRVTELGLGSHVRFLGTTTDLPSYYSAADVFVLLSDSEAGSVACLEAMSSSLPVVVSSSGGFGEVVDESCGRLVDIHKSSDVSSAILEVAQNKEMRMTMGCTGRSKILEHYSWEKIAGQLLEICKEIKPNG